MMKRLRLSLGFALARVAMRFPVSRCREPLARVAARLMASGLDLRSEP